MRFLRPQGLVWLAAVAICLHSPFNNTARPAAPDTSTKDARGSRDLLYLATEKPVLIRMHIRVDGRPFESVWQAYVDGLMQQFDADGNEVLTGAEVQAIPTRQQMIEAGMVENPSSNNSNAQPDQFPMDGQVTAQELARYLRRVGAGPFSTRLDRDQSQRMLVSANPASGANRPDPSKSLFKRLDGDQDGGLAAGEIGSAMQALGKFDLDDDEMISLDELQTSPSPYNFVRSSNRQAAAPQTAFLVLNGDQSPTALVKQLLDGYDKPAPSATADAKLVKNNKLDQQELGLPPEVFSRYDADSDGQLDFDELRQLLRDPVPTLEVMVRLGRKPKEKPLVEVLSTPVGKSIGIQVRTSAQGLPSLVLGNVQIELGVDPSARGRANSTEFFVRQFKAADTDNNAYLEKKEIERNFYFRSSFDLIDKDKDGKVFEQEVRTYVDQQQAAAQSRTVLTVADQGRNLFEVLDLDRDRRLGRREMEAALDRMTIWDTDADGVVVASEIPRSYRLLLGRGSPNLAGRPTVVSTAMVGVRINPAVAGAGPLWFQKMDRNRDGDVSRREFLGESNEFKSFDTDGNGLIDSSEATDS